MKKIGEGWQYSVYELGNGRVLKKFHGTLRSYWVIFKTIFPFKNDSPFRIIPFSRGMKRTALNSFEILKRRAIPKELIGNPVFLNELDYEQDKTTPLAVVLNDKETVDAFVDFNKTLLSLGIIDKSFNITKNFGIDAQGNVVLIDIGEIFDDPDRIMRQRRKRAWAEHYVAGEIKDGTLRGYFLERMDKEFGL